MSGRPADPSYTTRTFAPDANYPAGSQPWNGQATKVEPAGAASVGFEPDTGAAAEEVNKLFNDAFTQDSNAKAAITDVLTFVGQAQALNFPTRISGLSSSLSFAFFSKSDFKWYLLAGETTFASSDGALSFASVNTTPGVPVAKGDADSNGNVVASTSASEYVYEMNASTGTWTQRTVYATHTEKGHVVFDPVHSKWIWYSSNTTSFRGRYSSDRVTWTAPTSAPSGAWLSSPSVADLAIDKTAGRAVVAAKNSATTIKVATTDDGGVNWTLQTSITTTIDATEITVSHNADEGAWYMTIGESGDPSSEVWRSTDGASWTKKATLNESQVHRIAGFDAILVAVATAGAGPQIVYSLDSGATWKKAGRMLEDLAAGMFAGGGRPVALSTTKVYVGNAMGAPDLGELA